MCLALVAKVCHEASSVSWVSKFSLLQGNGFDRERTHWGYVIAGGFTKHCEVNMRSKLLGRGVSTNGPGESIGMVQLGSGPAIGEGAAHQVITIEPTELMLPGWFQERPEMQRPVLVMAIWGVRNRSPLNTATCVWTEAI